MCSRFKKGLITLSLLSVWVLVGYAAFLPSTEADAQEIPDPNLIFKPPDESRLYGRVVPDIDLRYADGSSGHLSDLWTQRPVFVTLVFSRCAGICSPYLGLLKDTVKRVDFCGDRYQMVVISFDLRDRSEDLTALAQYHGLEDDRGWTFAVPSNQQALRSLCQALDFDFRWDETRRQYNHPAITVALQEGKFVRISVGEEITPRQFSEMLADARGEFVPFYPIPGKRGALFRCFDYDPRRGFTPNWGMLILVFPAVAAITLAVGISIAARRANSAARKGLDPANSQSVIGDPSPCDDELSGHVRE